ncbi:MAG: hypothetical protein B7Z73_05485 [Planctomycetia bacterium 21-64-5]|nr:MAG: hypothetical protein B7Z73_05485 [Planctomycetia bacterium 21-64-5]HQU42129.1 hypothetical protein [Pirellulales bacterium]
MENSIANALYIAAVAAHEAAHCVVALSEGATLKETFVDADDGSGEARYLLRQHTPEMRAAITVGGPLAESRFLGKRNWRDCFEGSTDYDKMVSLAESAGMDVEQLIAVGYSRAKPIIDRRWNEIRRLAARILDKGGKLTFEQQPTKPPAKPPTKTGFARLAESSARLTNKLHL